MHKCEGPFTRFWRCHPALYISFFVLIGVAFAIAPHPILLAPLCALALPPLIEHFSLASPVWLGIVITCLAAFSAEKRLPKTQRFPEESVGMAHINIAEVKEVQTPFDTQLLYRGTLITYQIDGYDALHNLPFRLSLPKNAPRPPANRNYIFESKMHLLSPHLAALKPTKGETWRPIHGSYSFAEMRYSAKSYLKTLLQKRTHERQVHAFLSGLLTGDSDSRHISFYLSRLGLQHLLAISGFHFGILAALLTLIANRFLPEKKSAPILILLLSLYFFFIGDAPSVRRAWMAITFYLTAKMLGWRLHALNVLGLCMLLELAANPIALTHIGFQFSYAATSAILLFYQPIHEWITRYIPKRDSKEVEQMSLLDQHGYLLLIFLRKSFALNIAVHLITIPIALYHFHSFPWLSLIYNLFAPLAISAIYVLLLASLILPFLTPTLLTKSFLLVIANPPLPLAFPLQLPHFPFTLLVLLLTAFILIPIARRERAYAELPFPTGNVEHRRKTFGWI